MILVLIVICAIIIGIILQFLAVSMICKKMKHASNKEWINVIIGFFKARSERKLLYYFIGTEATLAGVLPSLLARLSVTTEDSVWSLWISIDDNTNLLSLVIAGFIAIGYYLYLYITNRKHPQKWESLVNASKLVNEELNFIPTEEWFVLQNNQAIKDLGKRYSKLINYPFKHMEFALASFHRMDKFSTLLREPLKNFISKAGYFSRTNDDDYSSPIKDTIAIVIQKISNLNDTADSYLDLKTNLGALYDVIDNYYWNNVYRKLKHNVEIATKELKDATSALCQSLDNDWILYKKHHYLLITGEAGTGKSHLIGDMVTIRKQNHEPSILLLGQHFTTASDPLSQIKELLDVRCKKDRLLKQLNNYGERINVPVVIFIDAINEGAGEKLWQNFLGHIISEIEKYEYLRIVLSFRTSSRKNWFYDISHSDLSVYHHQGFEGNIREACEYLFNSFGLDQPLWPVYGAEFANPLFLLKYCRNHERSHQPLLFSDFWDTINVYCDSTNHELSNSLNYNDSLNLVTGALNAVAELMVENGSRYQLEFHIVMERLVDVAKYTSNPQQFFDYLIDEGLLRTEKYDDKVFVDFGFERIGDYFIANYLINNKDPKEWFQHYLGDISEAITIIVPKQKNLEAFEIINDNEDLINAFIETSGWRESFCPKGEYFINNLIQNKEYSVLYDIICQRPFRNNNIANGETLYKVLWTKTMSERDIIWTTIISEEYGVGQRILDLAQWGKHASSQTLSRIVDSTSQLCSELLIWSLSSTWIELRDTSTYALVNLFATHPSTMISLLKKYYDINDLYIAERLWAAVLGALLCSSDKETVLKISQWTYDNVFKTKNVTAHILIRDYAKEIVKYGQSLTAKLTINEDDLTLPLGSETLPEIISTEDVISRFSKNWDSLNEKEKPIYAAQSAILNSMATEHSTRTVYGDFGRYVFQSYIHDFGENEELMSNWAIQLIFDEFDYQPQKFYLFDNRHASRNRFNNKIERIGKKYQWIAMYKIMAHLSDKHPHLDFSNSWATPIQNARNIDPTLRVNRIPNGVHSFYQVPKFNLCNPKNNLKWLRSYKVLPKIESLLLIKDNDSTEWINLFSTNNIVYSPIESEDSIMKRELWIFMHSFIANVEDLNAICKYIDNYGLKGNSFHENTEISGLFLREFYWSDEYKKIIPSYTNIEFSINSIIDSSIIIDPTYLQYRHSDSSGSNNVSMLLPNEFIYAQLGLMYAQENGVWINYDGDIVAFDNYMYLGGHRALLIKKDILLSCLNKLNKCIFWPIFTERMLSTHNHMWAKHANSGGWAYMDSNGRIHYKLKNYEDGKFVKKFKVLKSKTHKRFVKFALYLYRHHLCWFPSQTIDIWNYKNDNNLFE